MALGLVQKCGFSRGGPVAWQTWHLTDPSETASVSTGGVAASARRILPGLMQTVDTAVVIASGDTLRPALTLQHNTYIAVAKLLTKTGDAHLAWLAADRAAAAAARLDSPALKGLAAYQVVCALLELD